MKQSPPANTTLEVVGLLKIESSQALWWWICVLVPTQIDTALIVTETGTDVGVVPTTINQIQP